MIKGNTPTARAFSNGIPARKCNPMIPPTKTSVSPKRFARKILTKPLSLLVREDVSQNKQDKTKDSLQ